MNPLGFKLAILIVVSCLTAWGCSPRAGNANAVPTATTSPPNSIPADKNTPATGSKDAYPQEVVDEFLRSCQTAGSSAKLCACLFDKIQEKYSFEEFTIMELKLSAGNPPDDFVEFTGRAKAQCMR